MTRINGKDIVNFVRPLGATTEALYIKSSTENTHSIENELIDEQTKDGRIVDYGQNSESFEFTAFGERNDPGQMAIIDAIRNKEVLEYWQVDRVKNDQDSYDALFAQVVVESVEETNGDSFQELSGTLQVIGEAQKGTVTTLPAMPSSSQYPFEEPSATV